MKIRRRPSKISAIKKSNREITRGKKKKNLYREMTNRDFQEILSIDASKKLKPLTKPMLRNILRKNESKTRRP
ncbi:hypothetical protein BD293_1028 [Roseinatronobacter monicus]|uniref:Uncharacterized protein n=1 Tax=Roseinatronobacter monicus TaxID=393481 RepID=A0A543KBJ6_9RHOB|nr:hypothetical protein BD293_1028 [Roseinatronobacter monicus]